MSNTVTPNDPRFVEILSGLFHDLLRAGGVQLQGIKAFERIREVGKKTAETIEYHAERKAVDVIKKLQVAVSEAFRAMEKDVSDLKKRVEELEKK